MEFARYAPVPAEVSRGADREIRRRPQGRGRVRRAARSAHVPRSSLNERSPLRLLEKGLHGGLGKGNIGVVLAGPGVGKTAFLVGVALDEPDARRPRAARLARSHRSRTSAPTTTPCSTSSPPRRTSRTRRWCAPRSIGAAASAPIRRRVRAKLREAVKVEAEAGCGRGSSSSRARPRARTPAELEEGEGGARERRRALDLGGAGSERIAVCRRT